MESGKSDELNGERAFFRDTQECGFNICYLDGTSEQVKLGWVGRYTLVVFGIADGSCSYPRLVYKHAIKKLTLR